MNIGFFGHSIVTWQRQEEFSFIKLIKDYFQADIVNVGVAQCSEERILHTLKKTKNLDLAIIFHANPDFMFIPCLQRDFPTLDRDSLIYKIPNGDVRKWFEINGFTKTEDDILDFWKKVPNWACYEIMKQFGVTPFYSKDDVNNMSAETNKLLDNWNNYQDTVTIKQLLKEKNKFSKEIDFYLELFDMMELHKKHLYDHDLQMNRYYGALIQIDQYLSYKNIPVVHCLGYDRWYPSWVKFNSGIVEKKIVTLQHDNSPYYVSYHDSENTINPTGNRVAFDALLPLIDQAFKKVK